MKERGLNILKIRLRIEVYSPSVSRAEACNILSDYSALHLLLLQQQQKSDLMKKSEFS